MKTIRSLFVSLLALCAAPLLAQTQVVPGIDLVRGGFTPGSQPDGNSILFTTPQGLVVFDTGRHVAHTNAILDFARAKKVPIVAVINSHWHLDHIGGNLLVRRDYPNVPIYASNTLVGARKGFLANYRKQLVQMLETTKDANRKSQFETDMALIDAADKLMPDHVIESSGTRTIGGREFQIGLSPYAATAGDVWLFDQKSGVLIAGDLVTLPVPFLDTACPAGWQKSLDDLDHIGFELMIPGHGPPLTHRQFSAYRRAFSNLLACTSSDAAKSKCIDGWIGDTSELAQPGEEKFTRALMDYYVDVLRRPLAAQCSS